MKCKYTVYKESGYDSATGRASRAAVKSFRNEPDAIAFIDDLKNMRVYGELYLEKKDSEGNTYGWNESIRRWIQTNERRT